MKPEDIDLIYREIKKNMDYTPTDGDPVFGLIHGDELYDVMKELKKKIKKKTKKNAK